MKIIDLINLYRLRNRDRIEIRENNWFVLEAEMENIPYYIKNKEVKDFCFDDKLVINYAKYAKDEIEEVEDKEYENIEEITIRDKTIGFPFGEWTARNMDKAFAHKINALIKNQKYILERLDK